MTSSSHRIEALEIDLRLVDRELGLPTSKKDERRWAKRKQEIEAEIALVKAALPLSHLEAIDAAGFDIVTWQSEAIDVRCADGTIRSEWLPADLIHWERRRFVRWCTDDKYSFHGWEPKARQHSGGRYRTIHFALGWFAWHDAAADQSCRMSRVIVESPYAGDVVENEAYARRALRDCLLRGEAPIASHLLYTQPGVLDDAIADERALGIEAGLVWGALAEATVVYTDRGVSGGMRQGIARASAEGRRIEYRSFGEEPE